MPDEDWDAGYRGAAVSVYVELGGDEGGPLRTVYVGASYFPEGRRRVRLSEARLRPDATRIARAYSWLDPSTVRQVVVARFGFRPLDRADYLRAEARAREVERAVIAAAGVICGAGGPFRLLNTMGVGQSRGRGLGGRVRRLPGRR